MYINRLTNSLSDPDVNVRLIAICCIGMPRTVPDLAVAILTKELANPDKSESGQAADYLAGFGTNAAAAFPMLSNLAVNGRSFNVANQALRSLAIVTPDKALPVVFQTFQSTNKLCRHIAFGILCAYSPKSPEIEVTIERSADDPDSVISGRAKALLTEQYLQAHPIESQFTDEPVYGGKSLGEWLKTRFARLEPTPINPMGEWLSAENQLAGQISYQASNNQLFV